MISERSLCKFTLAKADVGKTDGRMDGVYNA